MDDTQLEKALFKRPDYSTKRPQPDMHYLHTEMRKKGVTLLLLWHEYKQTHPDGYEYTQFCEHYRRSKQKLGLVLRQEHRAGEKMFTDWAGQTVPIVNRETGEITFASIFVAVLRASNYTYAEAFPSRIFAHWITAHIHAFEFFNGSPEIMVDDNLKTWVTKPCRYEPEIHPAFQDMTAYYGTVVIPSRVKRPRDNAKAEAGVLLVERWILAVLRNYTFFSVPELNAAIREFLERLNNKKFQKLPTTRRELFEKLDRPALKPLPEKRYPFVDWKTARVGIDYHVEVDRHFYSVPYQLVGEKVDVRPGPQVVEILYKNRRVASHVRSYLPGRATTNPEHRLKAPTKSTSTGRPPGSSAGRPKSARPPPGWSRPLWRPSRIRSRATGPAWASSGSLSATRPKDWRRPVSAVWRSVPILTKACAPSGGYPHSRWKKPGISWTSSKTAIRSGPR
jgi:transposase